MASQVLVMMPELLTMMPEWLAMVPERLAMVPQNRFQYIRRLILKSNLT